MLPEKKITSGFYKERLQKVNSKGNVKDRVFVIDSSLKSGLMLYYKYRLRNDHKSTKGQMVLNNVKVHMHTYDLRTLTKLEIEP